MSPAPDKQRVRPQPTSPTWTRKDTVWLLLVCLVALVLRIVYLACLRDSVFWDHLVINAAQYRGWAQQGYPSGEPFYQSPLYVTWLRMVHVLSSENGALMATRIWQMLMGTASVGLAFSAAWLLAGRRAAIVSGLLAATAGMSLYFDLEVLPTALATLLLTAAVTCHVAGGVLPPARQPRWLWAVAALALGLAVITRPNLLLLAPVFVAHRLWLVASAQRLVRTALYVALVLLPVVLVTARNGSGGQGFVLLTTSVGDNLLLAHNDDADGLDPFPPPSVQVTLKEFDALGMNMVQRSRAAQDRATRWMQEHPGNTAALWWKKLVVFYNQADIPNNRSIRVQQEHCAVLRLPPAGWVGLGVLLPTALAGLVLLRRRDLQWLLGGVLVMAPLSLMPFLVCARFRTPLLPTLAILAGVGIVHLVMALRTRHRRALFLGIAAVACGGILAWPNWYGVQSLEFPRLATNRARLYRTVAEQHRAAGNPAQAQHWMQEVQRTLEQARAAHPEDATAHLWWADLQLEQRRLDAARQGYTRAAQLQPGLAKAHLGLARLAMRQQQTDAALEHYRAAVQADRRDVSVAVEYAEVLFRAGRQAEAQTILRQQLQRPDLSPQDRQGLQQLLRRLGAG